MSLYAQFSIPSILSHHVTHLWYTPVATQPTSSFIPSGSVNSVKDARRFLPSADSFCHSLPAIIIEDTTLEDSPNSSVHDCGRAFQTPHERRLEKSQQSMDSPRFSWLDDQTLTNTPRLVHSKSSSLKSPISPSSLDLSKEPTLYTPTLISRPSSLVLLPKSVSLCVEEFAHPRHPADGPSPGPSAELLFLHDDVSTDGESPRPVLASPPVMEMRADEECVRLQELSDRVNLRQPKLRRSNGQDDLRTLYRRPRKERHTTQNPQLPFEEQITLAILAEMERNPHRFGARCQDTTRPSKKGSVKSTLGLLATTLDRFFPPRSRV